MFSVVVRVQDELIYVELTLTPNKAFRCGQFRRASAACDASRPDKKLDPVRAEIASEPQKVFILSEIDLLPLGSYEEFNSSMRGLLKNGTLDAEHASPSGEDPEREAIKVAALLTNAHVRRIEIDLDAVVYDVPEINSLFQVAKSSSQFFNARVKSFAVGQIPEKPSTSDFWVSDKTWSKLYYGSRQGSILLWGETGTGKSSIAQLWAEATGAEFFKFDFGQMFEPIGKLEGTTTYDVTKGTGFTESTFVKALETPGAVILLDEITRCPQIVLNVLIPLLDGYKSYRLDSSPEQREVHVADNVYFIATANIGSKFSGTNSIDPAILDRFKAYVYAEWPSVKEEVTYLRKLTPNVPEDLLKHLARAANFSRTSKDSAFFLSPRKVKDIAEYLSVMGGTLVDAVEDVLGDMIRVFDPKKLALEGIISCIRTSQADDSVIKDVVGESKSSS